MVRVPPGQEKDGRLHRKRLELLSPPHFTNPHHVDWFFTIKEVRWQSDFFYRIWFIIVDMLLSILCRCFSKLYFVLEKQCFAVCHIVNKSPIGRVLSNDKQVYVRGDKIERRRTDCPHRIGKAYVVFVADKRVGRNRAYLDVQILD